MKFQNKRHMVVCGLLFVLSMNGFPMQDADAYSLERLKEKFDIIRKSKGVYLNENILLNQLKKVGIAFDPTGADFDLLKKSGASEKFLGTLRDMAKERAAEKMKAEAPPPPPPKPKEGDLAVSCKPVDCEVWLDGKQRGVTKQGLLKLGPLPEGAVKVSVTRKDWDADRDAHTSYIKDGEVDKVEFTFKESRAALDALGQAFFDQMIQALGGDAGIKEASRVRGTGARLLAVRDAKQLQWPVVALLSPPNQAKFIVTRAGTQHQVLKSAAGFVWDKQPREEGQEIEDALREVYDRQFGRTLELLRKAGLKKTAPKLDFEKSESRVFRIESGADTYVVTLDGESCPREIKLESTGLLSGLRLLYSDFVKIGNARYPQDTQVVLPGATKQGAGLRMEKVELGAVAVTDKDLEGKKNWKPLGSK